MKKGLLPFCLLALLPLLASCNDWLSVQPNSQVESDELFSDERGYKEALAGAYSSMVAGSTYGGVVINRPPGPCTATLSMPCPSKWNVMLSPAQ